MTFTTPEFNDQLREALERNALRTKALKQSEKDDFSTYWVTQFPDPPTAEGLHKHADRFSPDGVAEITDAYRLTLLNVSAAPASKAKRARRTSATMKTKVLNLHERGVVPAAIADTLNISDRYSSLKADRPGLGDIYEHQLEYEKESGDRPWLEGFYRRLEDWAQTNWRYERETDAQLAAETSLGASPSSR